MTHAETLKSRLFRLLATFAIILACGLAYAAFVQLTGLAVPCVFRLITGFKCPGCGISRMCLSLLHLDFSTAWGYNPAVMSLLPLGAAVVADMSARYVISGEKRADRFCNIAIVFMIAVLLIFGVLRNIV